MSYSTKVSQSDYPAARKTQNENITAASIPEITNSLSNNTVGLKNPHNNMYPDSLVKINSNGTILNSSFHKPNVQTLKEISNSYIGVYEEDTIDSPEKDESYRNSYMGSPTPNVNPIQNNKMIPPIPYNRNSNNSIVDVPSVTNNMNENGMNGVLGINSGIYEIRYLGRPNANNVPNGNNNAGSPYPSNGYYEYNYMDMPVPNNGMNQNMNMGMPGTQNGMNQNGTVGGSFINSGIYEIRYLGMPNVNKSINAKNTNMGIPALYNNRTISN